MNDSTQEKRRRRVKRLKKMIITIVLMAIILPVTGCSVLLYQVFSLKKDLREAKIFNENLMETVAQGNFHVGNEDSYFYDHPNILVEEVEADPTDSEIRKIYLTFDDGPTDLTDQILDILDQYEVKATFFVTGAAASTHPERYRAIVERGHAIGMHSYSHDYKDIYSSIENFQADLFKIRDYIEKTTGVIPTIYRFPGGSSNTISKVPMSEFCDYITEKGISYYDWNISSRDASNPMRSKEEIVENTTKDLENYRNAIILMHDSANKQTTVEALPEIIERIQSMEDTFILPITEDTVAIHHKQRK